jgi:hypothetical protein
MMNWRNFDMMRWEGGNPLFGYGFGLLAIWSLVWQGLALWRAAKNGEKYWFLALLLIHTAGILDLLYLFVFAKEKLALTTAPAKPATKLKTRKK